MPQAESRRLRRAFRLLLRLTEKRDYSVAEIAKEEEISIKTVRRDLELLRDEGFPLEERFGDFGKKFWRISMDLPQIRFEYRELLSLFMGRELLKPLAGTPMFEGVHTLFLKLDKQLFNESRTLQEAFTDTFYQTGIGASDYTQHSDLITTILDAVKNQRVVRMRYLKSRAEEATEYMIHPYGLVYHKGSLYIISHSEHADDRRHFKMDRVQNMEIEDRTFERPKEFHLEEYLSKSFGIFSPNGRLRQVRIRFSAEVANAVLESRWHPKDQIQRHADGSLTYRVRVSNLEEIKSWVMSWGSTAEVLSPRELVAAIREDVRAMTRCYGE